MEQKALISILTSLLLLFFLCLFIFLRSSKDLDNENSTQSRLSYKTIEHLIMDKRRKHLLHLRQLQKEGKSEKKKVEVVKEKKPFYDLIVLTASHTPNFDLRQIQRQTFQKESFLPPFTIKYLFLMGWHEQEYKEPEFKRRVEEEHSKYQDILFLPDVKEHYNNLTLKTREGIISIYNHYDFSFLMKRDDDTFVRPLIMQKKLVKITKKYGTKGLFIGRLLWKSEVIKKVGWKNTDFAYMDTKEYFPYMHGSGYIMSYDIVEMFAKNRLGLRLLFNEDTATGFWLAPYAIHRVNEAESVFDTRREYMCKPEEFKKHPSWFSMHGANTDFLKYCSATFIDNGYDRTNIENIEV